MSMYDHLKCIEIDIEEGDSSYDEDEISKKLEEVEGLLEKAYCVGALVDWPTLKRIREIKNERQFIRYNKSLAVGVSEREAATAFEL